MFSSRAFRFEKMVCFGPNGFRLNILFSSAQMFLLEFDRFFAFACKDGPAMLLVDPFREEEVSDPSWNHRLDDEQDLQIEFKRGQAKS